MPRMTDAQRSLIRLLAADDRCYLTEGREGKVAPHIHLSSGDSWSFPRRLFDSMQRDGWLHKLAYSFGWRYTASQAARDALKEPDRVA